MVDLQNHMNYQVAMLMENFVHIELKLIEIIDEDIRSIIMIDLYTLVIHNRTTTTKMCLI